MSSNFYSQSSHIRVDMPNTTQEINSFLAPLLSSSTAATYPSPPLKGGCTRCKIYRRSKKSRKRNLRFFKYGLADAKLFLHAQTRVV